MAASHHVLILWNVFCRIFIPHVLFGSILPFARGGGFSWENCSFRDDDNVRSNFYDSSGALRKRPFPWEFTLIHDGVRLGTAQRRYEDELLGNIYIQCPLSSLGYASILDDVGASCDNRRNRNIGGSHLLFLGVRVPSGRRYSRLESEENFGAAEVIALDMRNVSRTDS